MIVEFPITLLSGEVIPLRLNDLTLTEDEKLVMNVIRTNKNFGKGGKVIRITQLQIARSEPWLGCHPIYEKDIGLPNEMESTTRNIRRYIRQMREKFWPISSDNKGYYIILTQEELIEFLDRFHAVALAASRAFIDTFRWIQKTYEPVMKIVESDYLSKLEKLTKEETEKKKKKKKKKPPEDNGQQGELGL